MVFRILCFFLLMGLGECGKGDSGQFRQKLIDQSKGMITFSKLPADNSNKIYYVEGESLRLTIKSVEESEIEYLGVKYKGEVEHKGDKLNLESGVRFRLDDGEVERELSFIFVETSKGPMKVEVFGKIEGGKEELISNFEIEFVKRPISLEVKDENGKASTLSLKRDTIKHFRSLYIPNVVEKAEVKIYSLTEGDVRVPLPVSRTEEFTLLTEGKYLIDYFHRGENSAKVTSSWLHVEPDNRFKFSKSPGDGGKIHILRDEELNLELAKENESELEYIKVEYDGMIKYDGKDLNAAGGLKFLEAPGKQEVIIKLIPKNGKGKVTIKRKQKKVAQEENLGTFHLTNLQHIPLGIYDAKDRELILNSKIGREGGLWGPVRVPNYEGIEIKIRDLEINEEIHWVKNDTEETKLDVGKYTLDYSYEGDVFLSFDLYVESNSFVEYLMSPASAKISSLSENIYYHHGHPLKFRVNFFGLDGRSNIKFLDVRVKGDATFQSHTINQFISTILSIKQMRAEFTALGMPFDSSLYIEKALKGNTLRSVEPKSLGFKVLPDNSEIEIDIKGEGVELEIEATLEGGSSLTLGGLLEETKEKIIAKDSLEKYIRIYPFTKFQIGPVYIPNMHGNNKANILFNGEPFKISSEKEYTFIEEAGEYIVEYKNSQGELDLRFNFILEPMANLGVEITKINKSNPSKDELKWELMSSSFNREIYLGKNEELSLRCWAGYKILKMGSPPVSFQMGIAMWKTKFIGEVKLRGVTTKVEHQTFFGDPDVFFGKDFSYSNIPPSFRGKVILIAVPFGEKEQEVGVLNVIPHEDNQ